MGLFEEAVVKAKGAFDVAAKKTNEVVEIQKLKVKIAQLNSQCSKDFETLGRIYYDSAKSNSDISEQAVELMQSIDTKKEEIITLEDELDLQKKIMVCPECSAKNPNDAVYCSSCGAKLR